MEALAGERVEEARRVADEQPVRAARRCDSGRDRRRALDRVADRRDRAHGTGSSPAGGIEAMTAPATAAAPSRSEPRPPRPRGEHDPDVDPAAMARPPWRASSWRRSRQADDDPVPWADPAICDAIEGAAPIGLASAVARSGLAAGRRCRRFPRSLHRRGSPSGARVGRAGRRAPSIVTCAAGPTRCRPTIGRWAPGPLEGRGEPARPGLPVPAGVFEHAARRLAARAAVRETMGLVMGDLVPASAASIRVPRGLLRP